MTYYKYWNYLFIMQEHLCVQEDRLLGAVIITYNVSLKTESNFISNVALRIN
jgi:hypothetical protein